MLHEKQDRVLDVLLDRTRKLRRHRADGGP